MKTDCQKIDEMISDNLDPVIEYFDLDWDISRDKISSNCIIHNGDNQSAFYLNKENSPFYWKCFTMGCSSMFKSTPIGLVRALLSSTILNWKKSGDRIYSFRRDNWIYQ